MNPETYEFEPVTDETPDDWVRFSIGEEVTINGVQCRIRKITKKDIIVRPIKGRLIPGKVEGQ